MFNTRTLAPTLLALLVLLPAASASEPTPVRDGDRATGDLPSPGSEVGLALDALAGSALKLEVRATGESKLEPEILVYDPEDVRLPLGSRYRHKAGSGKARLRKLTLPVTGRYTIVVRGLRETRGAYRLRVRARHPRKLKEKGSITTPTSSGWIRFPAFAGTTARVKVKGRHGLQPTTGILLEPGVKERELTDAVTDGSVVRHRAISCARLGDYRLLVASRNGTTGTWKSRVKLAHPVAVARKLTVDGEPAGTFTAGMREPTPPPGPPPPEPPPSSELDQRRARWTAQGIRDYRFTLQRTAFAPPIFTDPVVVEVRGGAVVSRRYERTGLPVDPQYASWWPAVEGLFDILKDAYDRRADRIEVVYDPVLGHPTWASVDYDLGLGDDEHSFSVSGLVRLN